MTITGVNWLIIGRWSRDGNVEDSTMSRRAPDEEPASHAGTMNERPDNIQQNERSESGIVSRENGRHKAGWSLVGATLPAAPSVRSAKSRHFSMVEQKKKGKTMKVVKLERVYFSAIAVRLGAAIHMEVSIDQVNILVCGWNNRRERRGQSRINFARRIIEENEWRATRGLPPDYERFMFVDELELFSRYAGYDLTH